MSDNATDTMCHVCKSFVSAAEWMSVGHVCTQRHHCLGEGQQLQQAAVGGGDSGSGSCASTAACSKQPRLHLSGKLPRWEENLPQHDQLADSLTSISVVGSFTLTFRMVETVVDASDVLEELAVKVD